MARLSFTIGLPDSSSSRPYSARICGQSVSSGAVHLVVQRGDRGLQLVLAQRRRAERVDGERDAFGDAVLVPQRPVLLGQRDQLPALPVRARGGRR